MVNRPGFFKFYIPESSAESLKIPSIFVSSIQGMWPENVALRDRYNNLWQVVVEKVGDNWYFKDGWTKFVDDNMIKGGDMLVYEYFSQGLFDFKILGSAACEEKGVGDLKLKNTEEQNIMIESDDDVVDDTDDDVVDDTDDDDYVPTTQQENQRNDGPRGGQVTDGGTSTSGRGNTRDFDWYGAEIFRTGLVPQPINPYFVTKTRRNRATELYIPMDVIKGYNLQLPETTMLVDPRGRKFQSKRKIWKDGRVLYMGGWKTLCEVNFVGKDDKCICEFVPEDGGDLYLSVSFFRANRQQG